jgi:hypothetical protein
MSDPAQKPKCTPEQRAAIARANGARRRGPTTPEGLANSRRARFVHGCRARVVRPESELPGALEAANRKWNAYYKPGSPAAQFYVDIAADAEVTFKRAQVFREATLTTQMRVVAVAWERTRKRAVVREVKRLESDPATAVAALKQWGHGACQLLRM